MKKQILGAITMSLLLLQTAWSEETLSINSIAATGTYYIYSETGSHFTTDGASMGSYAMTVSTETTDAPEGSEYLRVTTTDNYASVWFNLSSGQDKSSWTGASLEFDVNTLDEFQVILEQADGTKKNVYLNGTYITRSGEWETATIPLSTFGIDLTQFKGVSFYRQWNGAVTLNVDNIRITGIPTTVEWEGTTSTDWNTDANWSTGTVPGSEDNVLIPDVSGASGNAPVISDDQSVYDIEVEIGGLVTIQSGAGLAIMGAASGDGSFNIDRNTVGSGGYSIVGSPVTSTTIAASAPESQYVYAFDGSSYSSNLTGSSALMMPGQGYFIGSNLAGAYVGFSGMANSGDIMNTLSTSSEFHLVANPYAAGISRSAFLAENGTDVIDGAIYLWDDGGANDGAVRAGVYVTIDAAGNVINGSFDGNIRSTQGFYVYSGASPTVTFKPTMQVSTAGSNSDAGYFRKGSESQLIKLTLSDGISDDELLLNLTNGATVGKDPGYDVHKLMNPIVSFYSQLEGEDMAIQALPLVESIIIKLGTSVAKEGLYKIKLAEKNDSYKVTLKDKLTGKSYDLGANDEEEITLNASATNDRFELALTSLSVLASAKMVNGLKVYGHAGELQLQYTGGGTQAVKIYTMEGKVAFNETIRFSDEKAVLKVGLKSHQIYVLKVNGSTIKFILNH